MVDKPKRILIIDDENAIRTIIRLVLARQGYECETAADGREGVETFRNGDFDLVISDIIMPVQDGINTIIALHDARPDVPVIAISGGARKGTMDLLQAAKKVGACETIEKPFEPDLLISTVKKCLKD